ncbi:MAG: pentapeptide repeat-containing protein [Bacteroidota bacterium]
MDETNPNKTDISDIKQDEQNRHILDNPDKIIRWIKHKFEAQKENEKGNPPDFRCIDLSNCIISTFSPNGIQLRTYLCDIITENEKEKSLECFHINGYGNSYYQEVSERVICKNSIIYSAFFDSTNFHKDVDFEGTEFNGYASFGNCLFDKHVNFQNTIFSGYFDFSYCTFNASTWFNKALFDIHQVNFEKTNFKGEFKAQKIRFLTNDKRVDPYISFISAEFHDAVDLSEIDFTRDCKFEGAKFYRQVEFRKSNFFTGVTFENAEIAGNLLFTSFPSDNKCEEIIENTINEIFLKRAIISGRIDFERCKIIDLNGNFVTIKNEAILRIYESRIEKLNLISVHNNGIIILEDNEKHIVEITLKSAMNRGIIEIENTEIQKIFDRKTARVLKDAAFKSGNIIDALKYKPKEMDLYKKELVEKLKIEWKKYKLPSTIIIRIITTLLILISTIWLVSVINQDLYILIGAIIALLFLWTSLGKWIVKASTYLKPLVTFFKAIPLWEYILLKLNTLSNNNGLSWFRGILFTLGVWFIFFNWFAMIKYGIGDTFIWTDEYYLKKAIDFLWLFSGIKGLSKDSATWAEIIPFIFGKIFIGYGIYQTISAFRKYGK